jgi:ligand-binding sensor domain-containing protein
MLIDKAGSIWVGTHEGVCRYDGNKFNSFSIPVATERDFSRGVTSPRIIWNMMEDRAGNIWFATNGGGAYRYDGKNLTNISKQNGLTNNFVNYILEDKNGDIWFATHHGGLSRYDKEVFDKNIKFATQHQGLAQYNGKLFPTFTTKEGLCGNEAWTMLEDKTGNLWISTRGSVCRYDPSASLRTGGKSFTTFTSIDGLTNCCVQSIFEDKAGNLWFGSGAGLFRFNGKSFINITKNGPWQ